MAGTRQPSLLVAAAVALVVGLAVAVLWVAGAVATGSYLAEIAIVVGALVGLVVRQWSRAGGLGPMLAATLVALVTIGAGMLFAALAVYSAGEHVSFATALGLLDRSFLPHLWDQIGALGAVLGVAGVVVAALLTLRRDPAASR